MNRFAKIGGTLAVMTVLGQAAHAATPTDDNSSFEWSGPYVGLLAGYSSAKLKYDEPDFPGFDRNPTFGGFTGGVFLGQNYRTDNIVWGVEADAGFGNLSEGADKSAINTYSAYDIDWNAHVRVRIGVVSESTLLYVAGGLAFARVTVDDTDPDWGKDDATHVGWTLGAGVEHAMTRNLRARAEYLYDDYGSKDYTISGPFPYRANVDLTAHTIRAGLSYRF